ncbi:helix-hairpin-helix domain-containing protein [Flavobacteriales bacterium]|nr:helix-hairpin-helix domain-containing protein [Flavobacteriales bacterium]
MRSERIGVWLLGAALFFWSGVELWRTQRKFTPEPIGVEVLLHALGTLPSAPNQPVGSRLSPLSPNPLLADSSPILVESLDSAAWVSLGLSPRQAASAIRYQNAVGGITRPDILERMRVLPEGWMENHRYRLVFPPVDAHRIDGAVQGSSLGPSPALPPREGSGESTLHLLVPDFDPADRVDLNLADSLELLSIRGVGPWVTAKILKSRRQWGGFSDTLQLKQALGWDSLALALMGKFKCSPEHVRRLCTEELDAGAWANLPGVSRKQGQVVVRYVNEHGGELQGLMRCGVLDSVCWSQLLPHLKTCRPTTENH